MASWLSVVCASPSYTARFLGVGLVINPDNSVIAHHAKRKATLVPTSNMPMDMRGRRRAIGSISGPVTLREEAHETIARRERQPGEDHAHEEAEHEKLEEQADQQSHGVSLAISQR